MNLVIAIMGEHDEETEAVDTGLAGEVIFNTDAVREEFVIPFANSSDAIDCLRIVVRDLERDESEENE